MEILVVDDELAIRKGLAAMLGGAGYSVRTARDGIAALGAIRARRPDLVLLDVMMPQSLEQLEQGDFVGRDVGRVGNRHAIRFKRIMQELGHLICAQPVEVIQRLLIEQSFDKGEIIFVVHVRIIAFVVRVSVQRDGDKK